MISNNEQISTRQFYKYLFSRSAAELDEIIDHAIEFRRKSNKVRKSSMREALNSDPFSRDGGKKLECITESFVRSDGSIYVSASVPVTNTSEADCSSDLSEEASFRPVLRKHLREGVHYDSNYVRSHTSGRDMMNQSLHRKWTEFDVAALKNLVPKHTTKPYWSDTLNIVTRERVDWPAVGKALTRAPADCAAEWEFVKVRKLRDTFTRAEDELYKARLDSWSSEVDGHKSRLL